MKNLQRAETSSSLSSLGRVIETFPLRKGRRLAWLVASLILLTASAAVKIYGIILAFLGWKHYGAAIVGEFIFWPLIIAVGLFLSSLIFSVIAYANWTKTIVLHQNGFIYQDRKGLHPWRWQDIKALQMVVTRHDIFGIHTGISHFYAIEDSTGKRLALSDGFSRVEDLGRVIEESTSPLLFDQAARQFNSGENLNFGSVMVNKGGIQVGRKSYGWNVVQQVSIQQGILKITKKGGGRCSGARVAVSNIPNLQVLLNVIDRLAGIRIAK